jgi:hypothetical protein
MSKHQNKATEGLRGIKHYLDKLVPLAKQSVNFRSYFALGMPLL